MFGSRFRVFVSFVEILEIIRVRLYLSGVSKKYFPYDFAVFVRRGEISRAAASSIIQINFRLAGRIVCAGYCSGADAPSKISRRASALSFPATRKMALSALLITRGVNVKRYCPNFSSSYGGCPYSASPSSGFLFAFIFFLFAGFLSNSRLPRLISEYLVLIPVSLFKGREFGFLFRYFLKNTFSRTGWNFLRGRRHFTVENFFEKEKILCSQ